MTRNTLLAFVAGGAVLALFLAKKIRNDIFGLKYSVTGISNLSLTDLSVTLQVKITNPGATPFPLYDTRVVGTVSINNSLVLGEANGVANQILNPGSSIVVPVRVVINAGLFNSTGAQIIAALSQPGMLVNFDGKIKVGGAESPLNLSYKYL